MAKMVENEVRPRVQEQRSPQEQGSHSSSSAKSKVASARNYLDTFYPGWDLYLKTKR